MTDKFGNTLENMDILLVPIVGKQSNNIDLRLMLGIYKDGKVYYYNKETKKVAFIYLKSRGIAESSEYLILSKIVSAISLMSPEMRMVLQSINK